MVIIACYRCLCLDIMVDNAWQLLLFCCARKYLLSHTSESPFTFTLSLIDETSPAGEC